MTILRKNSHTQILFLSLLLTVHCCGVSPTNCSTDILSAKPMKDLVKRLLPKQAAIFNFVQISPDDGNDVFELYSSGTKIVIGGNNAISQAVGLNWYLKYYCNTSVSWFADSPIELPAKLPAVSCKIRKTTRCKYRFFLNYCTFGYTMPWWDWDDWQRLIDWMALNGVNMPLAITGQEAIWQKVWKQFGLSDEQIRSYFTGPAHLPWHRMANIDYWGGPLPQSYIDNQFELQKKILKRQREFGMTPALPAFAGHVPAALKEVCPEAKINMLGKWGDFPDKYRAYFLDSQDALFAKIQKSFLEEQTKYFGTDHIYGTDPFNEVDPPSWEPQYLAEVGKTIYDSMADVDKDAVWLQMAWTFYYDKKHWTQPRLQAMFTAVPQDKMILLDYFCEETEVWRVTESFYGQPYIWCYLGNFGGNTLLTGNIQTVEQRITEVFSSRQSGKVFGLGSTLEALDIMNPVMYEFVLEKAWIPDSVDLNDWICKYAQRRCGQADKNAQDAWHIILEKVYIKPSHSRQGTIVSLRPRLATKENKVNIAYCNDDLLKAWGLMLQVEKEDREGYLNDLVNIACQTLANYAVVLKDKMVSDYNAQDINLFKKTSSEFLGIISDIDRLTATRSERLLGKWLKDARNFGVNKAERKYYEQNARNILTTWGDKNKGLNDYAQRNWAGLIESFYLKRWQMFVEALEMSLENKTAFDEVEFYNRVTDFEWNWTFLNKAYPDKPTGSSYEIAKELYNKYSPRIGMNGIKIKN